MNIYERISIFKFLKKMFKPEDSDDTVYNINTSFYITANEIRKQLFYKLLPIFRTKLLFFSTYCQKNDFNYVLFNVKFKTLEKRALNLQNQHKLHYNNKALK